MGSAISFAFRFVPKGGRKPVPRIDAHHREVEVNDFLLGEEPYKMMWANDRMEAVTFHAGSHKWAPAYRWFTQGKPFVRQRLARKGHAPEAIDAAVERLRSEHAIDDARTAAAIARTESSLRGRGRVRVRMQIERQTFRFSMAKCRVLVCELLDGTIAVYYGPHLLGLYSAGGELLTGTKRQGRAA